MFISQTGPAQCNTEILLHMLDFSSNSMHMQLLIAGNAVQTSQMEVYSSPSTLRSEFNPEVCITKLNKRIQTN